VAVAVAAAPVPVPVRSVVVGAAPPASLVGTTANGRTVQHARVIAKAVVRGCGRLNVGSGVPPRQPS
jgi:hypothetical protein